MSGSPLTVSQVNTYIKTLLEGDNNLKNIFVVGEISDFKGAYSSGHLYFSLKDENASISAVMFSSAASRLKFKPSNGMKVIVSGRVSSYPLRGTYQLYVNSMQPDGIGAMTVALEQLKKRLSEEGFFDESHKQSIPTFPKKIGVVTSRTGAVIQDIKNVVSRRFPLAEIVLYPSLVQGEQAVPQLVNGIKTLNNIENIDVIIIGRGGGSFEDLSCFNSEQLVKAIYYSKVPVISAVGHETDYTLCDMAADLRAPTPSAAAECAVPDRNELMLRLDEVFEEIQNSVARKISQEKNDIDQISDLLPNLCSSSYLEKERLYVASVKSSIDFLMKNRLQTSQTEIKLLAGKINALNPISLLQNGYSVSSMNDRIINTVDDVEIGDSISVRVTDGTMRCRVEDIRRV